MKELSVEEQFFELDGAWDLEATIGGDTEPYDEDFFNVSCDDFWEEVEDSWLEI